MLLKNSRNCTRECFCMARPTTGRLVVNKENHSLSLLCLRSAANERAGRSPGCGCWDQHHDSAAAGSVPPERGFHVAPQPCAEQCVREPERRHTFIDNHVHTVVCF